MAKIKVDVDALQRNASALEARISELQALNTRLEQLMARMQASWEGQSSALYLAKLSAQAQKARKMVDVLEEYKKYVETAVEKFSGADRDYAGKIRNSF